MRGPICINGAQALKAANTMIGMDHRIPKGDIIDPRQNISHLGAVLDFANEPIAKNILFGNDVQVRRGKPLFKSKYGKSRDPDPHIVRFVPTLDQLRAFQPMIGQQMM